MPPELFPQLLNAKVELANRIGTTMSAWQFEQSSFVRDTDYPIIDKELHLLMMVFNLTSKVEFLTNHIKQLESSIEYLTHDDGK